MTNEKQLYDKLFKQYQRGKMEKFLNWHHQNTQVYQEFKRLAKQWKEAGHKKCSATLLGNVLRWNVAIQTSGDKFKLPNDWLPIYARVLAFNEPEFLDFFEFRGLQE